MSLRQLVQGSVLLLSSASAFAFQSGPCATGWDQGFASTSSPSVPDGPVYVSAVFDDGSGPKLYIGGEFGRIGSTLARDIACWDGTAWSALGDAFALNGAGAGTGYAVRSLVVYDDGSGPALYAGGHFSITHSVSPNVFLARWNGTAWSLPGGGVTGGAVTALIVHDPGTGKRLYAAGLLTGAGGTPAAHIASWDGSSWAALGAGIPLGPVHALGSYDDGTGRKLFAGGHFTTAGGLTANNIARWDGASWSTLGAGVNSLPSNGGVLALHVFNDGSGTKLIVGGYYFEVDGMSAKSIAAWNGSSWSTFGTGFDGDVRALTTWDDGGGPSLTAGGYLATPGGSVFGLLRWNGAAWTGVGGGVGGGAVQSLRVHDDGLGARLFVGGEFTSTGGLPTGNLATWNGTSWAVLGTPGPAHGLNGPALALAVHADASGPALFAGGYFGAAGGQPALVVARWNGTQWSSLGSGLSGGACNALASFDDGSGPGLFAAGTFDHAGGVPANHVARWNGTSWSALLGGLGSPLAQIKTLCTFDDGSGPALYAAGNCSVSSGVPMLNIGRWNGTAWNPVGAGLGVGGSWVYALATFDDGSGPALYAGGLFSTASGTPVNNIARWDGTSWSAVGGGVGTVGAFPADFVSALCVFDDGSGPALYAGGFFNQASGVPAVGLARWDGTNWSAVPGALQPSSIVYSLRAVDDGSGPALSVGGKFSSVDGIPCGGLARWNGVSWSNFDGGPGGGVYINVNGGIGDPTLPVVYAQEFFDDGSAGGADLYVGGAFVTAGGYVSNNIARWNTCAETFTSSCAGDGASAPCPCANSGLAGHGCDNSAATGGSLLSAAGLANPDTVVLSASGELPSALSIFLQGDAEIAPTAFGDGLRCVGGHLKRLYVKSAVSGAVSAPQAGDPSIHARSAALGDTIPVAATRHYQVYYRDPNASFCSAPTGGTFNVSNAIAIRW